MNQFESYLNGLHTTNSFYILKHCLNECKIFDNLNTDNVNNKEMDCFKSCSTNLLNKFEGFQKIMDENRDVFKYDPSTDSIADDDE